MKESTEKLKEDTILGLSKEIRGLLHNLQVRLDTHFNRDAGSTSQIGGHPQPPNILDDIIETLKESRTQLANIANLLEQSVFPKIS